MALLKLKSVNKVIVNVVSLIEDYVVLEITEELRDSLAVTVQGTYYEYTTKDFIKSITFPVPNEVANQLGAVPIPANSTLIETRNIQLRAGIFSILNQYGDFGLSANDWEILSE